MNVEIHFQVLEVSQATNREHALMITSGLPEQVLPKAQMLVLCFVYTGHHYSKQIQSISCLPGTQ